MKTWVFKVELNRSVWRTVELLEDQTLHDLHYIIQDAFEWDDDHLYAFFMTNKAWDSSEEYGRPGFDMQNADEVSLRDLNLHPKKKFLYIFDFGDEIRHQITAVRQGESEPGVEYPRILEVRGEAPPQYPDVEADM